MKNSLRSMAFRVLLMTGFLFVGFGCVKIDTTLSLDRDGSGSMRAIYGMPTYIIKQAELMRQLSASLDVAAGKTNVISPALDIPFLYDEAILKAKFEGMAKDGIKLEAINLHEQGGWNYVDFTLKFKTLESLFKQSLFNDIGVSLKHLDDASCKLTINLPHVGNAAEIASVVSQENINKLTPFLNGLRVASHLTLPGDLRNSNSQISSGRHATWEWDFDKDSQALARLARDKMIVVFDVAEVRIKDFEKPASRVLANEK